MASMTKAQMARELDLLRHAVSQLTADKARLQSELDASRTVKCDGAFANRRDAMRAARELAMRTGASVKVQL